MSATNEKLEWFETIVLPHARSVRSYLRRISADSDEVDDYLSEALLRAYASEHWWRITAGRAYLFTIARNLVVDAARRRKVVTIECAEDIDALQSALCSERQLHARDELRRLQAVIDGFPPQCRRAFILRRIHEKSFADIAEEMDLSVSTVEKHVAKAVGLLMQAEFRREDYDFAGETQTGEPTPVDR